MRRDDRRLFDHRGIQPWHQKRLNWPDGAVQRRYVQQGPVLTRCPYKH